MKVKYIFQLKEPIWLDDHWPISIMGGEFRIVSKDQKATAFQIIFTGQSVNLAPTMKHHEVGDIKLSINTHDTFLPFVQLQLENAFTYLQCFFDVEILIQDIDVEYTGETEEEEKQIKVKSFHTKSENLPLSVPYDLLARAIMAAEAGQAPKFEATLVSAARTALLQEKYIDSFRFSFLLIESLYGNGKFKTVQLKAALKGNSEFNLLVATAIKNYTSPNHIKNSDTEILLAASPATELVIDHLVEMRGYYFHGNIKRKDPWRPHEQQKAESLARLSIDIALQISTEAAKPMFDEEILQRSIDNAKCVGATMTLKVSYKFRVLDDKFDKSGVMNFPALGTKATPKIAISVAKAFLEKFEHDEPIAGLNSATCKVQETGQKVFELEFHVNEN